MLFNIFEIADMILMIFIMGYIFHDIFKKPRLEEDDIVAHYSKKRGPFGIQWHDFWWAVALIAPSIIVHELGHKFTALAFGLTATFHGACSTDYLIHGGIANFLNLYCGLTIITIVLKTIGVGFLFFVPAFVAVGDGGTHLQYALISFAGPCVNLIFWLGSAYILKNKKLTKKMKPRQQLYLQFFKQINMFLFIFNMLPIPGFDGFNVYYQLFKAFV